MKKLIMMSIFALGTITAFAGNGEKEIASKRITEDSQEFFTTHKKYRIEIWYYISDGTYATSHGQTVIPETQCLDDTNIEILRSSLETAYQAMNPGRNLRAKIVLLEDCGW